MIGWWRTEVREAVDSWRQEPPRQQAGIVSVMIIALVVRAVSMRSMIRIDERVTWSEFVRQPWHVALSSYPYPNNHLFYTLLAKLSVDVFGDTLWSVRLPALLAGFLMVPATYVAIRLLYGSRAAIIAMAIVATSGQLVIYSTNGRGYTTITLAFLLLLILAIRLQGKASVTGWALFAVIAALGMWTVPVMLFPLGSVCVWFVISSAVRRAPFDILRLVVASLVAAGLSFLLYWPVIAHEGLAALTHNEFVVPSTWTKFVSELVRTGVDTADLWRIGNPDLTSMALAICAIVGLVVHQKISRYRVGVPQATLLWCALFLIANHRAPEARVWLWLFPLAAGVAGAGFVWLLDRTSQTGELVQRHLPGVATGFALVTGAFLLLPG